MTVITVRVPDAKAKDVSSFVKEIGGEIVVKKQQVDLSEDEDEVTHGVFFGENVKRVINTFKKG